MKVLFAVSEAVPYAKTGGLADVGGALPAALADLGHDVRLVVPRYRVIPRERLTPMLPLRLPIGGRSVDGAVLKGLTPRGGVVYFVDCPLFFDREDLYGVGGRDYPDNLPRFAFFSQAVVALAEQFPGLDLVHAHDWHTGLVAAYVHRRRRLRQPGWPVLFTVHNVAMQGVFPGEQCGFTALPWEYFTPDGVEFYGKVSCLKAGLVYGDLLTTVSETYAREIQTPAFGAGLEGLLQARSGALVGVLNGVDYTVWDPSRDEHLPARYGPDDLDGKRVCKRALQRELGLDPLPYAPLIGIVTRLTEQKGVDLAASVLPRAVAAGAQVALLGVGDPRYHELFADLIRRHPRQAAVRFAFDEGLAHRVEAGADLFLMPSRFEPSGLNQLYSLRYGTVPVVRRTGGLADSVTDATPDAIAAGAATGFLFDDYTIEGLWEAVQQALAAYRDRPAWRRIQRAGMLADFSWARAAKRYAALYEETIARAATAPAS